MEFTNQYLSYEEYVRLGGTLEEAPFNILELEARKNVDKYTFGRLIELETQKLETKICIYKLVNLFESYSAYDMQNKSISSENTDGYSISYSQATETVSKAKMNEIRAIIQTQLAECYLDDGTPYLYRGC